VERNGLYFKRKNREEINRRDLKGLLLVFIFTQTSVFLARIGSRRWMVSARVDGLLGDWRSGVKENSDLKRGEGYRREVIRNDYRVKARRKVFLKTGLKKKP